MSSEISLFFYIPKENRYSFNALFGASEDLLKEFEVYIYRSASELLRGLLGLANRDSILFISFCSTQIFDIQVLLSKARGISPSLKVVAGGPHPSGSAEETLRMGVDYVVTGEGEDVFRDILLKTRQGISLKDIFRGQRVIKAEALSSLDRYDPVSFEFGMIGPIEITRGCPFRCLYCQTPRLFPGRPKHRSIESIVRVVQRMKDRGLRDIRFISPNSLSYGSADGLRPRLDVVEELLKRLRGLLGREGRLFFGTFPSEVRPEHVTPDAVRLIKRYCDNDNIIIGAQSGSERVLRSLKRAHRVEDVIRAVKVCRDEGLGVNVDFIFGIPGETEEDQLKSLEVMQRLVEIGARVHAHYFMPLPGTPLEGAIPSRVSERLLEAINRLTSEGKIFGQWQRQMAFVKKFLERRYGYVSEEAS